MAAGIRCAVAGRSARRGPRHRARGRHRVAGRSAAQRRRPAVGRLRAAAGTRPHTHDFRTPHPVRQTVGRPRGGSRIRQRARRAVHRPAPDP
ncbi:hypothetical protein G6F40_014832 [Rhizopus arrhizus]|nr:hypothetical protein G6F40_014832 [Rhizopus arrhizus]